MSSERQFKFCNRCKTEKPVEAFSKNRTRPDGLNHSCRKCKNAYRLAWTGEANARPDSTIAERFWAKVDKRGPDECWMWKGAVTRWRGAILYKGRIDTAHRVSVILSGREIPPKMVVDHMCMVGLCVNPAHLRVTTQRINSLENNSSPFAKNARKTHCRKGHEYSPENTYRRPLPPLRSANGQRVGATTQRICLTCQPKYRELHK